MVTRYRLQKGSLFVEDEDTEAGHERLIALRKKELELKYGRIYLIIQAFPSQVPILMIIRERAIITSAADACDVSGPWRVDSTNFRPPDLQYWRIRNSRTDVTVKIGPVQGRRINYYDRAKEKARERNIKLAGIDLGVSQSPF